MNAAVSIPLPRVLESAFFPYAGFVVVWMLLFGGGARQGLWSDATVEIVALPLFAWALFRLAPSRLSPSGQGGLAVLCAIVAVPLLQLIPLPPALWTALPARNGIAAAYDLAGITRPWLPVSLDPAATWLSLLSLIPGAAVFLAMLSLDKWERRALVALMLAIGFIDVSVGFVQILGGQDLYFYAITNEGMAVGFFANGNHNATFLASSIPFAVAWAIGIFPERDKHPIALIAVVVLVVAFVMGVSIVGSRAGLGLGLAAGMLCIAMLYRSGIGSGRRILPVALIGFLIAVLIIVQFASIGWQIRNVQERDFASDLRWPIAAVTLHAAQKYLPLGTGLGTFSPIYEMSAPRTQVFDRYVNHAHDDWLELSLEGGIPALAVLVGFLAWFGMTSFGAWRRVSPILLDQNFARAGSIAVVVLLLHSIVDYPVRSIAIMTVLALSCGLLIPPAAFPGPNTERAGDDSASDFTVIPNESRQRTDELQ